jgi:Uncharacterized protein family UPF0004
MGMLAQAGRTDIPCRRCRRHCCQHLSVHRGGPAGVSDTILEMARHKTDGRVRKLVVAGCLVERFRDEIRKNIPEVDAVVGTGELENILAASGIAPTPPINSPFNILGSRAEGEARAVQGRFSRENWDGAFGYSDQEGAGAYAMEKKLPTREIERLTMLHCVAPTKLGMKANSTFHN